MTSEGPFQPQSTWRFYHPAVKAQLWQLDGSPRRYGASCPTAPLLPWVIRRGEVSRSLQRCGSAHQEAQQPTAAGRDNAAAQPALPPGQRSEKGGPEATASSASAAKTCHKRSQRGLGLSAASGSLSGIHSSAPRRGFIC